MLVLVGIIFGILVGLVLIFYGALFLMAYIGVQWTTRTHVQPYEDTPQRWGMNPQNISFIASDGIMLSGWYITAPEPRATVLLLHGFGGKPLGDGYGGKSRVLAWVKFFLDQNCSVLTFDFRGQGESGRAQITFGKNEVRDVQAAVEFLKNDPAFQSAQKPLVLAGVSFGAAVAMLAAPDIPEIDAVMAISSYADLPLMIRDAFKNHRLGRVPGLAQIVTYALALTLGVRPDALSPAYAAPRIAPRTLAVLSGTGDTVVSERHAQLLENAAVGPLVAAIIFGAAHGLIFEDAPEQSRANARRVAADVFNRILMKLCAQNSRINP